jgi:uncharacterized protein (DUF952 family)
VLYHVIEPDRWERARAEGSYTGSTRGRELDEEGFIHLSRADQVAGVLAAFYADLPDLLVLHIDEARLTDPVVDEIVGTAPDGTDLVFPHLYGPLPTSAVVTADSADAWR